MSAIGRDGEAGFTLIEAVTAVALTGLIAALIFPNLEHSLSGLSLRLTTATLGAELHAAHAAAIRTGAPVSFTVATDGRSYGWTGGPVVVASGSGRLESGGGSAILFYPDGSTNGGTVVARSGARSVRLTIEPGAGAISRTGA